MDAIQVIEHGGGPGPVFVLHGGPGAPGSAGPLARALAQEFHVFEPWQREAGEVALGVDVHVRDLATAISDHAAGAPVALVGESWGAMLALAFAAAHPDDVRAIALVGCGTFDWKARALLLRRLEERTTPAIRDALAELERSEPDPAKRFARMHELQSPLYTYERAHEADEAVSRVDPTAHEQSWHDMLRLQEEGVYPAAFERIRCPVAMFHGDFDPHPGPEIRASLAPFMPQLRYHAFERCGHDPLVERYARDHYLETLAAWLATQWEPSGSDD